MADNDDGILWVRTAHVCAVCFGRVLRRAERDEDGSKVYCCADCGIERPGHDSRVICSCGIKLRPGLNAGIRCVPNQPTPECPALFVAEQQPAGAGK